MARICPKCKEKIDDNASYCPFCREFLGDKSKQEVYQGGRKMERYGECLYCGMCIVMLIVFIVIGGYWWWW
jgi:hypothetical protein